MKTQEGKRLRAGVANTLGFVVLIWLVKIIEFGLSIDLSNYGIYPRTLKGSIGIFTGPLIHGDVLHLLSNTFPVLILGIAIFYFYDKIALWVIGMIYMITGFWVWVAAREAYHIGASGLVYGMLTFLLFIGFLKRDRASLSISFIILILYGGSFFAGVLPGEEHISWESHLMGALAGIFCAIYFKNTHTSKEEQEEDSSTNHPEATYYYTYVPNKEKQKDASEKYETQVPLDSLNGESPYNDDKRTKDL